MPNTTDSPPEGNREHRRHPDGRTLAYSMAEAAEMAGVSRSQLYEEAAAGRLATRKVGRRRIILAVDFAAWLDALPVG